MDKVMFEAADPEVFQWYIKNYGIDVNLFVDHSQIVQLECLRSRHLGHKKHIRTDHNPSLIRGRHRSEAVLRTIFRTADLPRLP